MKPGPGPHQASSLTLIASLDPSVSIWRSASTQWLRLSLNSWILLAQLPEKLGFQAAGPMFYLTGSGLYTNGTHDCYALKFHLCVCVCAHHSVHVGVRGQLKKVGSLYHAGPRDQTKAIRLGGRPFTG